MKRSILIIFCVLAFAILFVSCGDKKPDDISDDMYKCGLAALEIVDDYLDNSISLDEAQKRLTRNKDLADSIVDANHENDSAIPHRLSDLMYCMWAKNRGTGTDSEIEEKRQELAELLGK